MTHHHQQQQQQMPYNFSSYTPQAPSTPWGIHKVSSRCNSIRATKANSVKNLQQQDSSNKARSVVPQGFNSFTDAVLDNEDGSTVDIWSN